MKKTIILSMVLIGIICSTVSFAQQGQKAFKSDEVDVKPNFPGGEKAYRAFIQKEVKFPMEARIQNQKGVVYVRYLVGDQGEILKVEFAKFKDWILDANGKYKESENTIEPIKCIVDEAVRVVKKFPKHEPGQKAGKPVSVEMETRLIFFAAGK